MTEKQKKRRNRFNAKEDDFILADLNIIRDDEELSPVPLDHFPDDEDAIDRLLIDTDFDTEIYKQKQVEWTFPLEDSQTSTPDFDQADDCNEISDDDAIDRLLINTGCDINDEQAKTYALMIDTINAAAQSGENMVERSAMASDVTIMYPDISNAAKTVETQEVNPKIERRKPDMITDIKPEQDSTNKNAVEITAVNHNSLEQENIQKQLNDSDHKIKRNAAITYASLAISIVALISAIIMGVLTSGMRTEISKLTELVSILEEDMTGITEKNSDIKFNSNDTSIEQLNKKINSLTKQLHAQSVSDTSRTKLAATAIKQTAINKSLDERQTRIYKLEKPKPSKEKTKKASAKQQVQVKKSKNAPPAEDWSVNLVSFKEKSFAKSKAAGFIQKGVPVKVMTVDVNNKTLYRLKVGGFKNKLVATSYASKIKKSLNLSSVSVDRKILR